MSFLFFNGLRNVKKLFYYLRLVASGCVRLRNLLVMSREHGSEALQGRRGGKDWVTSTGVRPFRADEGGRTGSPRIAKKMPSIAGGSASFK